MNSSANPNSSSLSDASQRLKDSSKITFSKEGAIEISVTDPSAQRAAAVANGYVQQVGSLNDDFVLTEAAVRRYSLERLLPKARQELDAAEKELATYGNLGRPNAAIIAYVKASTSLKAQISMKELEIAAMRSCYDPSKNPYYIKLQQDLSMLWAELGRVENGTMLAGNVSNEKYGYYRKVRDKIYAETRYVELMKLVDLARLEESTSTPVVQVLERAEVPLHHSGPRRAEMVIHATVATGLLAIGWVLGAEALKNSRDDEERGKRIRSILHNLRWRS